jgi:hypothetical protein
VWGLKHKEGDGPTIVRHCLACFLDTAWKGKWYFQIDWTFLGGSGCRWGYTFGYYDGLHYYVHLGICSVGVSQ